MNATCCSCSSASTKAYCWLSVVYSIVVCTMICHLSSAKVGVYAKCQPQRFCPFEVINNK